MTHENAWCLCLDIDEGALSRTTPISEPKVRLQDLFKLIVIMTPITACPGASVTANGTLLRVSEWERKEEDRERESVSLAEKYLHVCINAGLCIIYVQYVVCVCTIVCMCVSGRVGTSNYRSTTNGDPLLWNMLSNLISSCTPNDWCGLVSTLTAQPCP